MTGAERVEWASTSRRVKGHAFDTVMTNVYGDKTYRCECGHVGPPSPSADDARWWHRIHKQEVLDGTHR